MCATPIKEEFLEILRKDRWLHENNLRQFHSSMCVCVCVCVCVCERYHLITRQNDL